MLLTIIIFILVLGILIFVHEAGHFFVARRNGIKAEEFGFGFPPRIFGFVRKDDGKRWRVVIGSKQVRSKNTVYSLNWVPLGGFVKIKGEDGESKNDPDSFASKSPWTRTKVLGAGVVMNLVLAWVAISFALMIGAPQALEEADSTIKSRMIQISGVVDDSPAQEMDLKIGDQLLGCASEEMICEEGFLTVSEVQDFIGSNKGEEIILLVKRGDEILKLTGVPRSEYPSEQGPLGISLVETAIVSYPWYQAIAKGFVMTINLTWAIIVAFYELIRNLIVGEKVAVDVAGPVGIVYFTKQVADLGFVYVLQFVALLSINLAIINGLPFPALDGGRILFILIEKLKGSPVSEKVENAFHTIGFALLISLMIFVTFRDLIRFEVFDKFKGLF